VAAWDAPVVAVMAVDVVATVIAAGVPAVVMATVVVMAAVIAVGVPAAVMATVVVPAAAMATAVVVVAITVGSVVPWVPAAHQVAVQATRRAARVVSGSVPRIAAGKHWYHYRFWRY